ncbi:MAG: mechanosensitive ion channel family protein [Cyanobacteria bacterium P01_C01_bin.72]
MRQFTVFIKFQAIAATTVIAASAMFALPSFSQEVNSGEESVSVETVEADANKKEESHQAVTTKNPELPVPQLELLLKPLTQEQIKVEADAWLNLLQEKVQEISDTEIAIQTQEDSAKIGGAVDTEKEKLVVSSSTLKTEQSHLVNRLKTVLDAWDDKGGESDIYRQYVGAVSGIELGLRDTGELVLRFTTWLKSPEGGIRLGIDLLKFSGILIATVIIAPKVGKLADKALGRINSMSNLFRNFAVMIVKRSVLIVGSLLALASIGVNLGPILAVVGGASFVLAFALQDNLGNFASGLMLLITKPFDVGDEVRLGGYWAYVDSISLASTKLKDFGGNIVTLPNNTVWNSDIINYTHADIRKVKLSIDIKFNQDVEQIKQIWFDIASAHPQVLETPGASIFPWNSIYNYSIGVGLSAWSKTDDYWGVYVDLLKALQKRLEEENIELAAPVQEIKLDRVDAKEIKQLTANV